MFTYQGVESVAVTGAQLHEKITAVVHLLKWKGGSPNDRVLMTVPVSVEFYAIAIAVFAVGEALSRCEFNSSTGVVVVV